MGSSSKLLPQEHPPLVILIVGCGIGGLTLANLLERAGRDYIIFEKASEFKPLGSAICLSSQAFTFLDQLGLYKKLERASKPFENLNVHTLDLEKESRGNQLGAGMKYRGSYDNKMDFEAEFGYEARMLPRPDLVDILLENIPKHKIRMQKRILSIQQNDEGVMLRAADGTTHHGDICVAADGCYSAVRQSMFAGIEHRRELPPNDKAPLQYDLDCVVGVTNPLPSEHYAELAKPQCEFQVVLVKQMPVSIWYMPLTNSRLGWMINQKISTEKRSILRFGAAKDEENNFKQTEWSPDAAVEMCNRFKDQPTPYGTILADLFNHTPQDLISKVMLEEKYFETWTDGRTCLIGDSCHKVLPFAAIGATQAMHDALQLANLIYDIPSNSYADIQKTLREYHSLRKDYGKAAVKESAEASWLFHTKGIVGTTARKLVLNHIPDWVIRKKNEAALFYRPQCTYLPFVRNVGTADCIKQSYAKRYVMEQQASATVVL